jgi:choline-sulfatase
MNFKRFFRAGDRNPAGRTIYLGLPMREAFFAPYDQSELTSVATIRAEDGFVTQFIHQRGFGNAAACALAVALAAASVACQKPASGPEPVDVLIITIDTLRADSLEPYGTVDTLTPNIARLAEQGVVYESASTPITVTRPAHSSIFTGLYPDQHGVLHNGYVLPEDQLTLAEILKGEGYQTGGFVGVRLLGVPSGLAQGFDAFDAPVDRVQRRAKMVVDPAVQWLTAADPEVPVLMWVHLYDPHLSYNPPPAFRRGVDPELSESLRYIKWNTLKPIVAENDGNVPAKVLEHARLLYRGEVEYTDRHVGRLLRSFDRIRGRSRSMVVLTADHGECFENGIFFTHQDCLWEGTIRVPLIVRYPGRVAAGLRIEHRVSNLDVTPTVLSELGLNVRESMPARPLQEVMDSPHDRYVLIRPPKVRYPDKVIPRRRVMQSVAQEPVAERTDPRTRGLVSRWWKYLGAPGSEQLFRLPDETRNLADLDPQTLQQLLAAIEAEQSLYPAGKLASEAEDAATLEMLEALGYVQ